MNDFIYKAKLRVHIAPMGFEVDRIFQPLEELKADKVWLLEHNRDDKAIEYQKRIVKKLKHGKIDFRVKNAISPTYMMS